MEPHYYETYFQHETHHWWFRWRYDLVTRVVASLPPGDGRPLMLDAGCGTGQMLKHLQQFGDAVGLDVSGPALGFASSRGTLDLVLGSVTRPPFPPATFDRVFILDVVEHVDDDLAILRGLFDLIKPGGHLIATVPAFQSLWSDHDRINRHRRRYVVPQMSGVLTEAGFEIERVAYCNALLFPLVYPMRRAMAVLQRRRNSQVHDLESDLQHHHPLVNEALFRVLRLENRLTARWNPPFGVSILAIARKPAVAAVTPAVTRAVAPVEATEPLAAEVAG
jgi:SAM-dependent methyltransferase